jgi:hypothetical protein
MGAVSNTIFRRHRAMFNLLMSYAPLGDHLAAVSLRDIFDDGFNESWHLTRIYCLLDECRTRRPRLKTCENYFQGWGTLSWFETFLFLLRDSILSKVSQSDYANEVIDRLAKLTLPINSEQKIQFLQVLEQSILNEDSSMYKRISNSLQINPE